MLKKMFILFLIFLIKGVFSNGYISTNQQYVVGDYWSRSMVQSFIHTNCSGGSLTGIYFIFYYPQTQYNYGCSAPSDYNNLYGSMIIRNSNINILTGSDSTSILQYYGAYLDLYCPNAGMAISQFDIDPDN